MGTVTAKHIIVTGAAGYLGRAIVRAAEARGHHVTQLVRTGPSGIAQDLSATSAAQVLSQQIRSADAIIHAASEMSGDWAVHERSSLPAIQNICALAKALDAHLVHISSIVIYDFEALSEGASVTETSPVEPQPEQRDGYVRAKLAQEEIVAEHMPNASVLRVGAIYGQGRVMNAHLGVGIGPVLLRLAARGQVPIAHREMVAEIAVRAAEEDMRGAVNVLDDDLPDRIRFIAALSASGWPKLVIPFSWKLFAAAGALLSFWKTRPGLLRRKVLHARMKPLAFDTALLRSLFSDLEAQSFEGLMKRAMQND